MVARNTTSQKPGALDLQRRANALGVSKSHLSRVIAGQRESNSLSLRLVKLLDQEALQTPNKTTNPPTPK